MKAVAAVWSWLEDRLPLNAVIAFARHKTVPVHRLTVFYYLGGMTLFFFLMQIVTGILLMLYYRPSAEEAFESMELLVTVVPFGWLMRSVHAWSANLMVFFAAVHLATVFFVKAYRKPREMTWMSGVLLLFLSMAFGFSGYLLPWNKLAFFATKVGTDIAGAVPWIGDWALRFLRGGDRVTGATLSRFYGWHVAILPAITASLVGLHVLFVQVQGMSVPRSVKKAAEKRAAEKRRRETALPAKATGNETAERSMPFIPHFALRDLFGWTVALGVLVSLAALFPWELGEKADAFAPAFAGIRPEWYFVFMFETLKLVPGGEIFGLEFEAIPILGFAVLGAILLLVPFLDRRDGLMSKLWTVVGVVALVYVIGFTAYGYRSLVPVFLVLLTGGLMAVIAGATHHRGSGSP